MDSENQQRYQPAPPDPSAESERSADPQADPPHDNGVNIKRSDVSLSLIDCSQPETILAALRDGQLLTVSSRRRNGLVLYKGYHAEFAGPGSAVGGMFDRDCRLVIPVGDLSLLYPESHDDRQRAYLIRRQWIRLTQQFTDKSLSLQRAQMILNQFETYFDAETVARLPDEAFAMMVGVLPQTIRLARRPPGKLKVRT
ncbi:hypothetical protein IQ268_24705 [Oculatella sp. LEGE 06141]|uniref:hypothetical protein n=1 Tax=Oculatella sp. LEGE 06141 TaxID=1828648 RepID=UPI00188089EE|nr:hypothetical protein [Oculatella sp. LEGE 06141]MBE9181771.1 hypothetical protein [Oculatella sp. LEGE 06141]